MNITQILEQDSKKVSDAAKVASVAEVVAKARQAYGNADAKIDSPMIATTEGDMKLEYVTDATKVSLIAKEIRKIKMVAVETAQNSQGVNPNKLIETLLSTSPILVNISDTTEFEYL